MSLTEVERSLVLEQKLDDLKQYRKNLLDSSTTTNSSKKSSSSSLSSWLSMAAECSAKEVPVSDDLKREMAIYEQALSSAKRFFEKLPKDDFYPSSERVPIMVKSVQHMQKVNNKLADLKKEGEDQEKRRRQRELKKLGKHVQRDVLEKRRLETKESLASIDRLSQSASKDKRRKAGQTFEEDFDVLVEQDGHDDDDGLAASCKRRKLSSSKGRSSAASVGSKMSRSDRNAKYGFGGPNKTGRFAKRNTRTSTDDIASFDANKNKAPFKGRRVFGKGGQRHSGKGPKVTAGGNRPGKARRAHTRASSFAKAKK